MKHSTRISIASTVLLTALVVGLAGAHQFGQQQGPALPPGPPMNQSYPGPLGMADFGKIISGEFTGDLKRDAVVMDGMQPKLLFAPEIYDTAIPLEVGPTNDIATLSGLDPHKDYILTVGWEGLMRHERISADSSWVVVPLRDDTTVWAGAREIAVGNLDGTGAPDLVGIGANGRKVIIEYGNLDGTYTAGPTFPSLGPQQVTDVWLLNWREDGVVGGDEIALNTAGGGVQLRSRTAGYLEGVAWADPILGTVVVDDADDPAALERLALITKVSGLDSFWIYGDVDTEPYFSIGAAGVVSMASGDANHDGDTEVFLSVTSEATFFRMDNEYPAATSFAATPITKYSFGPPGRDPLLNHAGLAPGDFDSDGELDMLCPAQGDLDLPIEIYGSVDLVNVGSTNAALAAWKPSINRVAFISDTKELEFHVTRPSSILPVPVGAPAGSTTRISVKVFLTPDLGIGTVPAPLHFQTVIDLPVTEDGTSWFRMPTLPLYSLENSEEIFSLVLRQTVYDDDIETDYVLDIAPAMTGIFTADPNIYTVSHAPETQLFIPPDDGTTEPVSGGMDVGPTVPSMDEDEEPKDEDPRP